MTTEEQKVVEEAASKLNWLQQNSFIKGAQFLSELRKPSEELIQTNDVIKMLESIKKDANNLHSGNVAHQKVHIIGGINYLMEEIAKLMQPDVNAELLGALKLAKTFLHRNDLSTPQWKIITEAISNYEKQQ